MAMLPILARCLSLVLVLGACTAPDTRKETGESSLADPRASLAPEAARSLTERIAPGEDRTPGSWPGDRQVAVALTFDLDAELVWLSQPDAATPAELSRGRFGVRAGLPRVLDLLDRHEVPATFFMAALILELHPGAVEAIRSRGRHEIGYHGYGHERVRTLTEEQERAALRRGLALFDERGLRPRIFRSPSWNFSPHTLSLLQEHGFRFDSSLMADDRPYEILAGGEPSGIIELPVDWSLDDWPYFQLDWSVPGMGLRDPEDVLGTWIAEFEGIRADGGLFTLTLHPQVIGRWSRLRALERLVEHIKSGGDAWFATLGAAGEHVLEMEDQREAAQAAARRGS